MSLSRREFIQWTAAAGAASLAGCATTGGASAGRVVVIGAGIGGGTAAKYIKMWSPDIDVTIVEREAGFISCPISNLVLAGNAKMEDISRDYRGLTARGINVVRDEAQAIDPVAKSVRLAGGAQAEL